MRRWSVRTRLTVFVTAVFVSASALAGVLALRLVHDRLVADTRSYAEQVLGDYLSRIYGGTAATPTVAPTDTTSFFFLDSADRELTEAQYRDAILADAILAAPVDITTPPDVIVTDAAPVGSVSVDSAGRFVDGGRVVRFQLAPRAIAAPAAIDRGEGVVAVAQMFELADGTQLQVGVSSPLRPVTDGLDALRGLLWIGIPVLTLAVAGITWLAATRALRPVHAITMQARAITASSLSDRVPVPSSRDEVHELASTVNEMLARLDASHRRQRQFVADASHELRSPVAASRVQLEVALADPGGSAWTDTAEAVLAEQQHLGRLVDDLLALGRLDENGVGVTSEVDLDELAIHEATRPHRVPVDVRVLAPVRITGNPQLLTRALRNLVENAARHAATRVQIELTATATHATIRVDDNGPGVAPGDRERIFERFTRLDEARNRTDGGAGLGLAIAREVARAHGGDVTCDDAPRGGARFILRLPVA